MGDCVKCSGPSLSPMPNARAGLSTLDRHDRQRALRCEGPKKMNVGIEIIAAFEDLEFLPEWNKQLKVRGTLDQPHISGTGTKRGRALAPATIRAARGLFF